MGGAGGAGQPTVRVGGKSAAGLDFVVGDVHGEFSTVDRCRVSLIGVWRGLLDRYVAVGWR